VEIIGMMNLTEKIYKAGLADRPLSVSQIHRLLGGSDVRRYGQVNRALKAGELIKPRRGLYVLNPVYRKLPLHPFVLAQQMQPGSYVSAESALGFHGWIPEPVIYFSRSPDTGCQNKRPYLPCGAQISLRLRPFRAGQVCGFCMG
jgi:hypothetical protein